MPLVLILFSATVSAQPETAYEIRPIDSLRYIVPQAMVVDYVRITSETIPAYESLVSKYRRLLRQDSVLIAQQRMEIEAYERQEVDLQRIVTLYDEEIAKRREIERLYSRELRKVKWWRRGMIAAGIATLAILVVE